MENQNLELRKKFAACEEKVHYQERLFESVKSELMSMTAHKTTLAKALDNANNSLKKADREADRLTKMLQRVIHQKEHFEKKLLESGTVIHGDQSGLFCNAEKANIDR